MATFTVTLTRTQVASNTVEVEASDETVAEKLALIAGRNLTPWDWETIEEKIEVDLIEEKSP